MTRLPDGKVMVADFEEAFAGGGALLGVFGDAQIEGEGPILPLGEGFQGLPLGGGGDEPVALHALGFRVPNIADALEGGGKILANLARHEAELPARRSLAHSR